MFLQLRQRVFAERCGLRLKKEHSTYNPAQHRWQHSNNEINLRVGVGINNRVREEATKRRVYIL
jgi:hypothetical protein